MPSLRRAKRPDRKDFTGYGGDTDARIAAWAQAVRMAQALADEWQAWLERPDPSEVQPL